MAEDLFEYLLNVLVKDWNTALSEERYKIATKENGDFYIMPIK